ncbi:MAG TPA: two-component regulator propeller domain-containing protein, partial [Thermoanaerobaculia bacterium]|nr:two-component regulator propeller domain-containing protein [Thermoanaerobaculia bacterium]
MNRMRATASCIRWAAFLILILVLLPPGTLRASRLPSKTYTTADGLARDFVTCVEQDSRGFLWFCTAEGLSRFDGYPFTNYHVEEGLPANFVSDFLQTKAGVYWCATPGGLARFDPAGSGPSRFRRYPLGRADGRNVPAVLYEDRDGGLWCGTSSGDIRAFYLAPGDAAFRAVAMPAPDPGTNDDSSTAFLVDRRGTLWIGTPEGLYRRDPGRDFERVEQPAGLTDTFVMQLLEDREGRIWVGTRGGLVRMEGMADPARPPRRQVYTRKDGLPSARIESLLESSNGTLWVGTNEGLAEWVPGKTREGREFRSYTLAQGLAARAVGALAQDRDGNLWVGTYGSGAMKVARSGFTTYAEADGALPAISLLETRRGETCLVAREEDGIVLSRFDGERFVTIRPRWPEEMTYFGWGRGQVALEDHAGDWWIATGQGLARFSGVLRLEDLAGRAPAAVYGKRDGLSGDNIFRVFEDSRGDIWIGTIGPGNQDGLAVWNRATGRITNWTDAGVLPPHPAPTAFLEDRAGNLWIGFFHWGAARYRNGHFDVFPGSDRLPGNVRRFFMDSAGRLWIGTAAGLVRVDDPSAERPRFSAFGVRNGLASDDVAAIAEDGWGRLYAATGRGIDRFEPRPAGPARVKHYTSADGVAAAELQLALRDRQGNLWFSTPLGVSRLAPSEDRPRFPPPVLVTGVSIGGVPQPVSDLGQTSVSGFKMRKNPLRIDYVGLGFSPGEALRYQYRLEGADPDWSPPTDQRGVVYAHLSPGTYRFLVRAVASEGAISREPASVAFRVLPPVWLTNWFLVTAALAAFLILYLVHRYRIARVLAMANLRTRIATDLHDDIGAGLSQIAILSEVAQRPPETSGALATPPLSDIAGISRELVDSMSDIVWAINPEHDRMGNLVHRMRRFATDVLGGQGIAMKFVSSVADEDLRIGADVRRQIYLIFKESIHNVVRHSRARNVEVSLDGA